MMSCRPALRSTISLNSALDACARGSQWEWSVQTLATEPARDEISFSSTTSAYANCNLWPKSLCMLGKMKENLLRPHEIMYNSVAASFEHSGHWRLATGLFHEMCSKNLADLISIGLILSRYSESAPWFSALILGSQMSQMRLPSSSMSQHALVKSILTAPAGFAWRWARQLLEVTRRLDIISQAQQAVGGVGSLKEQAEKNARAISKVIPTWQAVEGTSVQMCPSVLATKDHRRATGV
eukprot:g12894.t1